MKRKVLESPVAGDDPIMKKVKQDECSDAEEEPTQTGFVNLDENLLFEVLKHVDPKTLATAACVNKQWHKTSQDERLWELICTRRWANLGCSIGQLRSVVLALGGFRRLHAQFLSQLSRPPARWGKDEVRLSLSLLSIHFYEEMNSKKRSL